MNLPFNLPDKAERRTVEEGPVAYLDGSSLARPATLPRKLLPVVIGVMVVAAVIGFNLFAYVNDNFINAAAKAQAGVEENLARDVSIDLPSLAALMPLENAAIQQTVEGAGHSVVVTSSADDVDTFSFVKLPSDVSVEEAGLMYLQGISKLSAPDAARLLNGSWNLDVTRKDNVSIRVRYADFTSGSIDAALQNAIVAEGLDGSEMGEAGVDGAGNTYQTGTLSANGTTYTWRVSALPLDSVYDVNGFPESAVYVGIRMTA